MTTLDVERSGPGLQTSEPPINADVAWTYGDMVKAIFAVIVLTLVTGAIAGGIATALLDAGQEMEEDATAYSIALFGSMILGELVILAGAVWFGPRKYRLSLAALGLRAPQHPSWWLPGALGLAGLVLVYGYEGLAALAGIEPDVSTPDEVFANAGPFIIVAIGAIVLAPVIEELFFRGFLFAGLQRLQNWRLAAVLSGLIFALAHLSIYVLPPFTLIGIMFAWAYRQTGSIKASIIAHAIINIVTVSIGFITSSAV